ncbi:hypothetical protein ACQ4PT_000853 [Festuca glaucescens]
MEGRGGQRDRRPAPANSTSTTVVQRCRKRRPIPPPANSTSTSTWTGQRGRKPCPPPANSTSTWTGQRGRKPRRTPPPANSLQSIADNLGPFGVIMVLFETQSGFAIFYFDRVSLYKPDAMENIWANFVKKCRADSVLWPKKFQVFKDKYDAINLDTGLNNQLTKMILKWHLPGQKLAVGKPEYKTVIEAELGILCLYDEPVMELMRGLKYLMHSIVPEEKSKLAEEDGLQASQGLKLLLDRYGFDVKPEMVNQCIIETACNLYDCDSSLKKQTKSWRLASDFLEEVSSIDSKDWEIPKLATALKIVCYPEDEIVFGNPHKMFTPNELSKLVTDAPKYEDSGIVKAIILGRYKEMVFLYDLKAQHKKELASLIKKAKEAYEAEQTRDWRGERSFE